MNPSLLKTEGIIFLSQQGALISLNIYYFGSICLHLQAVETSCFPSPPHNTLVCSGRLLRTSLKDVFLGHQDPGSVLKKKTKKKFIYRTSSKTSCWLCTRLCQDGAYTGFTQKYFRRVKTALSQNLF